MDDDRARAKAAVLLCQVLILALIQKGLLRPGELVDALRDITERGVPPPRTH